MIQNRDVCPIARQAAHEIYKADLDDAALLQIAEAPETKTDDEIKIAYYGLLGRVIDQVTDRITNSQVEPIFASQLPDAGIADLVFSVHAITTIKTAATATIHTISGTPLANAAQALHMEHRTRGNASGNSLARAIHSGVSTASGALLGWLASVGSHAAETHESSFQDIARRSHGSLITIASLAIDHVSLLAFGGPFSHVRSAYDPRLNQYVFADSLMESYALEPQLEEPTIHNVKQVVSETKLKDIPTVQATIGCPILFQPKQIKNVWNWLIDEASDAKVLGFAWPAEPDIHEY